MATDVRGVVVKGAGHRLMEEAPAQFIPELVAFLTGAAREHSSAAAKA